MDEDLPAPLARRPRIDGENDGLRTKTPRERAQQIGVVDGGRVDRYLVGARPQQHLRVVHRPHAPAHGEGQIDGVPRPGAPCR